ncbi:MAG: amidase family protein, partial [Gammaproteobacteria bacterium]|nr:amidase family protein [Gammaproteobacteria bacterium]
MYHTKTLSELSTMLEAGDVTSVQLTEHFLQRIKDFDSQLNSFITVTEEQALSAAAEADKKRKAGNAGPLTGIPFAHKDIFCT